MERAIVVGAVLTALYIICAWGLCCMDGTAGDEWEDIPCYETERYRVCFAPDWKGERTLFAEDRRTGRRGRLDPDGPRSNPLPLVFRWFVKTAAAG